MHRSFRLRPLAMSLAVRSRDPTPAANRRVNPTRPPPATRRPQVPAGRTSNRRTTPPRQAATNEITEPPQTNPNCGPGRQFHCPSSERVEGRSERENQTRRSETKPEVASRTPKRAGHRTSALASPRNSRADGGPPKGRPVSGDTRPRSGPKFPTAVTGKLPQG